MTTTADPPYVDYHEEFPGRWELAGNYKRFCPKCGEIKHPKAFRKILTRAQAEARGYHGDPTERPLNIESKFCSACRGEWLRPSQIKRASPVKLLDEVENGRLREQVYVIEMYRRRKDPTRTLRARQSRGGINRWRNYHQDRWIWMRDKVAAEFRFLDQRSQHLRKNPERPLNCAMRDFGVLYRRTLAKLRAESNYFKLHATPTSEEMTWEKWVGPSEYAALHRAWGEIETLHARAKGRPLRRPLVLDTAMPEIFARCPVQPRRELDPELQQQIAHFAEDQARGVRRIR